MRYLDRAVTRVSDVLGVLRRLEQRLRARGDDYRARVAQETRNYKDVANVADLPPIAGYWGDKYVRPLLEELGVKNPEEFLAKYLAESARAVGDEAPVFLSIGAGNCDNEARIAHLLRARGLDRFVIECLDLNPHMLARGRELAAQQGLSAHLAFVEGDFNRWRATRRYAGIMANQSLHHVLALEALYAEVARALAPGASFIVSDMIGRNGHQRWPEALAAVQRFWQELPPAYRYNQQLKRHEASYINWDCSKDGFEGIRAQEVLPLLLARFHVAVFVPFGNVIDIFVDRGFGWNFDADAAWDRDFIDRVHAFDEEGLQRGTLTPTHMLAVLTLDPPAERHYSRGIPPERCVRRPDAAP